MIRNSSDPVSSPVRQEQQRGQESDSDDENDFTAFMRHKREIAETAVKQKEFVLFLKLIMMLDWYRKDRNFKMRRKIPETVKTNLEA
jgi:hypothetical protein